MIRVGIGGWNFAEWRGTFYPKGHPQAKELDYASKVLSSIEINGTFYRTPPAASFKKWAGEVPDGFVFSVKGPMSIVGRGVLAETGPQIEKFFASGVLAMGDRLGPLFWQFMPAKKFDPKDVEAFFKLLPKEAGGVKLRHAVEARHQTFAVPEFVELARAYGVAIVLVDSEKHPLIADPTSDFVYLRLQRTVEKVPTGYKPAEIKTWASRAKTWEAGGVPDDLTLLGKKPAKKKRDAFVYFISGAKVRAPAAAQALIKEVG
ncbi:MAG: DUF72 domain-containing protein [Alphaproteobacteria bacterium]|nr:DUF72 domain-containing protein [Alphaproteobacteria bacterium]